MEISNNINALKLDPSKSKNLLLSYGPALVTALLVFWIAAKLVSLTWLLLDKPSYDATPAPRQITEAPVQSIQIDQKIETIRAAHLFGKYVEPAVGLATTQQPDIVPETTARDLTLKGTVASTNDNNGLAIIENKGEETVYTVGETIAPGLTLTRVFATEIHLSRGGLIEKLVLPKLTESNPSTTSRSAARAASRSSRTTRPKRAEATPRSSMPTKLGDLLRPQPVFQNGKQLGYRVYPGRKREQFKALGLKAGDLVTEINGSPLDDPSRGLEIFRSLNESTQVSVTVQRNGAQTSLVLDTSQLNIGEQ